MIHILPQFPNYDPVQHLTQLSNNQVSCHPAPKPRRQLRQGQAAETHVPRVTTHHLVKCQVCDQKAGLGTLTVDGNPGSLGRKVEEAHPQRKPRVMSVLNQNTRKASELDFLQCLQIRLKLEPRRSMNSI